METNELSFELPKELIAQTPAERRGESRLMVCDRRSGERLHTTVDRVADHLQEGSLLVFNDSRVRKARVFGRASDRDTGGSEQEILLIKPITPDTWLAIGKNAKRLRPGRRFIFPEMIEGEIIAVRDHYREIRFSRRIDDDWLSRYGHIPLPPYIQRTDTGVDEDRYQTIYARNVGSVAAPTAGLHFTPKIIEALAGRGIGTCTVTLHVGIGTFFPIRTETVEDHKMHSEEFYLSPGAADQIERTRQDGRPVVAVGTTSVRTLESAWDAEQQRLRRGHQSTRLYIYPGYRFSVVNSIFTNFHTPESTLLAMISAFAGRNEVLSWYREAIEQRYRFYSYGDAMLIR